MKRREMDGVLRLSHRRRSGAVAARKYESMSYMPKSKTPQKSADTIERYEIHSLIKESLIEGKGRVEILAELMNKYPNSSVRKYFEQYIEHHMKKMGIKDSSQEVSKDDEGR